MADKYKFYTICPSCHGTGILIPDEEGNGKTCKNCLDEEGAFGAKVFNGLRHVYAGVIEEIE